VVLRRVGESIGSFPAVWFLRSGPCWMMKVGAVRGNEVDGSVFRYRIHDPTSQSAETRA